MMKYGANMVECHPSTPMLTAKSHETILCTDTKTGRTRAERRIPASAWSFHCRGVPRHPMQRALYILGAHFPVALSLITARSGRSATKTNSELAVKYVITALGSHMNGERMLGQTPLAKS